MKNVLFSFLHTRTDIEETMTMKLPAFVLGGALVVWLSINLLPFLLVGETWAMLWMPLNWPLSAWVEVWLGIGSNSYVLVFAVTALNGVVYGSMVAGVVWVAARLRRKRTSMSPIAPVR